MNHNLVTKLHIAHQVNRYPTPASWDTRADKWGTFELSDPNEAAEIILAEGDELGAKIIELIQSHPEATALHDYMLCSMASRILHKHYVRATTDHDGSEPVAELRAQYPYEIGLLDDDITPSKLI